MATTESQLKTKKQKKSLMMSCQQYLLHYKISCRSTPMAQAHQVNKGHQVKSRSHFCHVKATECTTLDQRQLQGHVIDQGC
jgi:hypothetical protein